MSDQVTEELDPAAAPFGAARAVTHFYDAEGRPADEADAAQTTTSYVDAAGAWCGCARHHRPVTSASTAPERTTMNDPGKRKLLDGPLGFVVAFLAVGAIIVGVDLIFNVFG